MPVRRLKESQDAHKLSLKEWSWKLFYYHLYLYPIG
jgi:hypothetical protein